MHSSTLKPLPNSNLHYRPDIDGLRAIAVLSVIGFHAFGVKGGFVGVDIFFVISGFLISTILLNNLAYEKFSFLSFYAKRIKRIFPALILVLFVNIIIGWFILLPDEYKQLGKHVAGASVFVSNFILWKESGYFDNAAITKPLLHLWSLGVEEQFYIIWPLMLWVGWKKNFNFIYTIAVIAILSLALNIYALKADAVSAFYFPQTRFWELLCGSFIAWVVFSNSNKLMANPSSSIGNKIITKNILSLIGLGLIIFSLAVLTKDNYFFDNIPLVLLPTIGTVCIILAGVDAWVNHKILSKKWLVWFGLISFPLYLWHWPLLVYSKLSIADGVINSRTTKIFAVLLSILLAWITYKLIETPIRFGARNKTKVILPILTIGLLGGIGFTIYLYNGLNFRVPEILQNDNKYVQRYPMAACLDNDKYHFGACMMTKDPHKKTILLWGDSHAAHFYPGYKDRFGKDFNVVLISETGCRPILDHQNSDAKCSKINNHILDLIKQDPPAKIVLSAAWGHHDDWMDVTGTIDKLKALGIKNIDVIGPAPDWINTLPRQLFIYSHLDKQHRIPARMSFGLEKHFLNLDVDMQKLVRGKQVNYISLAKILCNAEGCKTRVGPNLNNLITLDYGHFTELGAIYIVSKFPGVS